MNGNEIEIDFCRRFSYVYFEHTNLFHIPKLNELGERQYEYIMDKGLLKNEWIHVEFKLKDDDDIIFRNAQMGIHVWKEKSNTEEENVVFTDPYIRKTKSDEDINASLSQKKRKRKRFSIRINLHRKIWARFRKQKEHRS